MLIGFIFGSSVIAFSIFSHGKNNDKKTSYSKYLLLIDKHPKDNKISLKEQRMFAHKLFNKLDKNKDSLIERHELSKRKIKRMPPELLEKITSNAQISSQEFKQYILSKHQKNDVNNDGFLTKKEYQLANKKQLFNRLDSNKDNAISFEEFVKKSPYRKPKKY